MGSVEQSIIEDNSMVLQTWIESNHSLFSNISKSDLFVCVDNDNFRVSSVLHSHPISSKWKKNILVFSITLSGAGKYIKYQSSAYIPAPGSVPSSSTPNSTSNPTTPTSSMMSLPTIPSSGGTLSIRGDNTISLMGVGVGNSISGTSSISCGTNSISSTSSIFSNISSIFTSSSHQSPLYTDGAQYIVIQSIQRALQRYVSNIKSDTIEYNKIIHYRKNEGMHFPTMDLQPINNNNAYNNNNNNLLNDIPIVISSPPTDIYLQIPEINITPINNEINNNNNNNNFKISSGSIKLSSSPNTTEILDTSNIDDTLSNCTDCEDDNESSASALSRQGSTLVSPLPLSCIHNVSSHSTISFKKITPILTSSIGSIRASKSPNSQSQSYPSLPSFSSFILNSNTLTSTITSNPTPPNSVNSSLVTGSLLATPTSPVSISRSNSQLTTSLPLSTYECDNNGSSFKPGSYKSSYADPLSLSISPPNGSTNGTSFGAFRATRSISTSKDLLPERTSIQIGETPDGFGSAGICSLYGWDYENKIRFGEPFADSFCIDIDPHPYIKAALTIADGSGHGEEPQRASRLSVIGSNEFINSLSNKEILTTNELMNMVGNSILQAHKRIVDNDYYTAQEIHIEPKGATTFCIGTLCKLKDPSNVKDSRSQSTSPLTVKTQDDNLNNNNNLVEAIPIIESLNINTNSIKNSPPKSPECSISSINSPPSNSSTPPSSPININSLGQWLFLVGSVGDSKAFRWSCTTGNVTEITNTNSKERNFNDAGGQLGWMYGGDDKFWPIEAKELEQNCKNGNASVADDKTKDLLLDSRREKSQPHLKNLHFAMALVNPGDRVFITSDGISDNFLNNNQISQRRTHRDEIEFNLTKFLKSQSTESLVSCESMVQAIVSFCIENTQQFRSSQEEMSKCLLKMKEIEKSGQEDISKPESQYHQLRKLYSKLSNNSRNIKIGKPDHASIVMYEIPKDSVNNKKEE